MQKAATLLAQNPWLQGPAETLAGHKVYIAWAKPAVNPVDGSEPLAFLSLRHEEDPNARTTIVLGPDGYFNDNCFFATEAEVLSRHKPLWPAYHALHAHMKQLQAQQLLPNIHPEIVKGVMNNPFGFFAACTVAGSREHSVQRITVGTDRGVLVAIIEATLMKLGAQYAHVLANIKLAANRDKMILNAPSPPRGRGKTSYTTKTIHALFDSFFDRVANGKGTLLYMLKQSMPIVPETFWFLPIVHAAYIEKTESLSVDFQQINGKSVAAIALESAPTEAGIEKASMMISDHGDFNFVPEPSATQTDAGIQPPQACFKGLASFARNYALFLRRPAPRP